MSASLWYSGMICFKLTHTFLALLDYVSRAHEIEICPSSVVRPSSVGRPSVRVAIISELNAWTSYKF